MSSATPEWKAKRWMILALVGIVLLVEIVGLAASLPAWIMNIFRIGVVLFAGGTRLASPGAMRRLAIAFGALTALELVLFGFGVYVALVWVLRIFLYPLALLFATPPGGEVRYAWLWTGTFGVMAIAFLIEKAYETGSGLWIGVSWGAAIVAVGIALYSFERVYRALISLKFATVCLVLLALLSMLGTLIVQRPPIDPAQYPDKFAAGQVGFLVNGEVLLGITEVPQDAIFGAAQEEFAGKLQTAFGDQVADQHRKRVESYEKRQYLEEETNRRIAAHRGEVEGLRTFLDSIFFTRMFKSYAFNSLLGLLVLSLIAVMASKWPFDRYGWGPVMTHAGIVVVILGCAISDLSLEHGFVNLTTQGPQSVVSSFADQQGGFEGTFEGDEFESVIDLAKDRLDGPGRIEFESHVARQMAVAEVGGDGEVDWFAGGGRPVPEETVRQALASWGHGVYRATPTVELPFRVRMTAGRVEYYDELRVTAPKLGDHGRDVTAEYPLLEGKTVDLFPGGEVPRYRLEILEVLHHARIAGGGPPSAGGDRSLRLVVATDAGPVPVETPATPGAVAKVTTPLGDFDVEVVTLASNYAQHEQGVPLAGQDGKNPAARVRVRDPNGEEQTVWIFQNFPQFYADGAMGSRNPKVRLEDLVLVSGGGEAAAAAPVGALDDQDVTPLDIHPDDIPGPDVEPVVKVRLTHVATGTATERWLRLAERDGRRGRETLRARSDPQGWLVTEDGEIAVRLVETGQQSIYETHVDVFDSEGQVLRDHVIRVNEPLVHEGFRFYQSNYDDSRGAPVSGLTVKRDFGIPVIYFGFLLTTIGLVFAFYVLPPLRRRAEARKREEFGQEIRKGLEF